MIFQVKKTGSKSAKGLCSKDKSARDIGDSYVQFDVQVDDLLKLWKYTTGNHQEDDSTLLIESFSGDSIQISKKASSKTWELTVKRNSISDSDITTVNVEIGDEKSS